MDPVIVLAGGFGTRLKSVVADRPKPLAPVEGRPFLAFLLDRLYEEGAQRVILSLHFEADQLIQFARSYPKEVEWVVEPKPLGTGGGVRYAVEQRGLPAAYVVNGDTYVSSPLKAISAGNLPARMGLFSVPDTSRYGSVTVRDGLVSAFQEKKEGSGAGLINGGIYRLERSHLENQPEVFSLEKDVFPQLAQRRELEAHELEGDFIDIGIPEDYERFQRAMVATRAR